MIFNKIDAYKHIATDETDEIQEKTAQNFTLQDWKKTWMQNIGAEKTVFMSAVSKENIEEFRRKVYTIVREIHITRFPYNKFLYPIYEEGLEEED